MSILDTNNDFDLTVTDIWEVRVNWYKYDNEAKFERRLKEELNRSRDLIYKLEVNQKSPPELTNLIESLLPLQATNISSLFKIETQVEHGFNLSIFNSAGAIVHTSFINQIEQDIE